MSIDATWLSTVVTKAFVEKTLEFAYDENDGPTVREAVITFKYEDIIQEVRVIQSIKPKEYVLAVKHQSSLFVVPQFIGSLTSGTVYWGDGAIQDYSIGLQHTYSDSTEVEVLMRFQADVTEQIVKFKNIDGMVEIDLSGM